MILHVNGMSHVGSNLKRRTITLMYCTSTWICILVYSSSSEWQEAYYHSVFIPAGAQYSVGRSPNFPFFCSVSGCFPSFKSANGLDHFEKQNFNLFPGQKRFHETADGVQETWSFPWSYWRDPVNFRSADWLKTKGHGWQT